MLLKLLIYLEGNWENICKTRGDGNFINPNEKIDKLSQSCNLIEEKHKK